MGSLLLLILARPSPQAVWVGVPFVAVGEIIRLWSSGYLTKLHTLVTAGPFAVCRNPLYMGSFLINVGYLIMCNRLVIAAAGIIVFWIFHIGAILYEEKLLRERFGDDFKEYCARIPRFRPRFGSMQGYGQFSVGQVIINNEHRGAIGTLVISALFALMAHNVIPTFAEWIARMPGK